MADKITFVYERWGRFTFDVIDESTMSEAVCQVFCEYIWGEEFFKALRLRNWGRARALSDYLRESLPRYLATREYPADYEATEEVRVMQDIVRCLDAGKPPLFTDGQKTSKSKKISTSLNRYLYFAVSGDVLKVGSTGNVQQRLTGLRSVFGLDFNLYRSIQDAGHLERSVLGDLHSFYVPVMQKYTAQLSRETFQWCDETQKYVDDFAESVATV